MYVLLLLLLLLLLLCVSVADEEFDELCFEFGIELDEVVSCECVWVCVCVGGCECVWV